MTTPNAPRIRETEVSKPPTKEQSLTWLLNADRVKLYNVNDEATSIVIYLDLNLGDMEETFVELSISDIPTLITELKRLYTLYTPDPTL